MIRVELRYAGLPFIGFLAVHYWFVVEQGAGRQAQAGIAHRLGWRALGGNYGRTAK